MWRLHFISKQDECKFITADDENNLDFIDSGNEARLFTDGEVAEIRKALPMFTIFTEHR